MGPSRGPLGAILEVSGALLVLFSKLCWVLGALLGPSWGPLGGSEGHLGSLLGPPGAPLGPSWGPLGPLLGPLGAILDAIDQRRGGSLTGSPRRSPKMSLLGPSWAALGAVLGALGAVFGPSWALLGNLRAILRPQESIGREKARRKTNGFCLLTFSLPMGPQECPKSAKERPKSGPRGPHEATVRAPMGGDRN